MDDIGLHPDAGRGRDICRCERCDHFYPWLDYCADCDRYICGDCSVPGQKTRCICHDCFVKEQEGQPVAEPSN